MLEQVLNRLQDKIVIICTILTFLVPYVINFINRKMHQAGDPPWKKEDERRKENEEIR